MIRGIGVDLLCLSRLHKLIGRRRAGVERLGKRILTPAELSALPVHSVDAQLRYLGVRWSAKEAAYKALYPHYQCRWQDLEVGKHSSKPAISSSSINASISLHLSISHDGDYVTAFVVAEERV